MIAKVVILVVICSAQLLYDLPRLRKGNRKTKWVYSALLVVALYQSLIFVFDLPWPFLHTLYDALFGEPARWIVESLRAAD